MANESIKHIAKERNVPQWRIAIELGVSEATLTRWLRIELPPNKKQKILDAIERIAEGGENR